MTKFIAGYKGQLVIDIFKMCLEDWRWNRYFLCYTCTCVCMHKVVEYFFLSIDKYPDPWPWINKLPWTMVSVSLPAVWEICPLNSSVRKRETIQTLLNFQSRQNMAVPIHRKMWKIWSIKNQVEVWRIKTRLQLKLEKYTSLGCQYFFFLSVLFFFFFFFF